MMKRVWAVMLALCLCAPAFLSCRDTELPEVTQTEAVSDSVTEAETTGAAPKPEDTIKFSLFSDFHYKENMYMSTVEDMGAITEKAFEKNVDFLMQTGDFCNDYVGSPEITNAYLENQYNIPAYGVYGNHELESAGNSMKKVTPLITSEKDAVIWGTEDGKIGDGSIGYYYFEVRGFRVICLDTNYSYNPAAEEWEHNKTASYGYPSGNKYGNALGPVQEEWLEGVLHDAADNDIPCIIFSHIGFAGKWSSAHNSMKIRAMFKEVNEKKRGTVVAAFSGHLHTNRAEVIEGVFYMDVNTVRNGRWIGNQTAHHYTDQTFSFTSHNSAGKPVNTKDVKLTTLSQAKNTWFFTDPLSCIVTVRKDGYIKVEGSKTTWLDDVIPPGTNDYIIPQISSGSYKAQGKPKSDS